MLAHYDPDKLENDVSDHGIGTTLLQDEPG